MYSALFEPEYFLFFVTKNPHLSEMNSYEQFIILFQTFFILSLLILVWFFIRRLVRPYEVLIREIKSSSVPSAQLDASQAVHDEVSYLVGSFKSIINQLKAKEQELETLHRVAKARADSSEKYARDILSGLREAVISLDENGRFLDCNPAMETLLGRKKFALYNLAYQRIFQDNIEILNLMTRFFDQPRPMEKKDVSINLPEGESSFIDIRLSPLTDPGGVFYGMIGQLEDITEARDLQQRLHTREQLAALGEMAAGIAHEFKNSLSTISGYAQMLHGNARPGAEVRRTRSLLQEVEEMARVISDFLEYARPLPTQKDRVDLSRIINELLESFRERFPAISFQSNLESIQVLGEKALMKKAFHNLFLNSVQALEESKLKSEKIVEITMERPTGSIVVVRIRDNGPGMDSRTLSRIFTPFFTTRAQGTGLGLAVVQKIISTMGGSIEVWSEPGKGFSSKVAFPADPTPSTSAYSRPTTEADESH